MRSQMQNVSVACVFKFKFKPCNNECVMCVYVCLFFKVLYSVSVFHTAPFVGFPAAVRSLWCLGCHAFCVNIYYIFMYIYGAHSCIIIYQKHNNARTGSFMFWGWVTSVFVVVRPRPPMEFVVEHDNGRHLLECAPCEWFVSSSRTTHLVRSC